MKKIIVIFICLTSTVSAFAQMYQERYNELKALSDSSSVDAVIKEIMWNTDVLNSIESRMIRLENSVTPRYKLYPTQNMWTFLELDTSFGHVSKVQWTTDSKKVDRFKRSIGWVSNDDEPSINFYPGRYELYATTNIYNFILVDTRTGKTWQVQWGTSRDEDGIWSIE